MADRPQATSDGERKSSALLALLERPVVARVLEPVCWCLGLSLALDGAAPLDARAVLEGCSLYVAGRLLADTAPNLVVAEWLERDPYDERRIRRALTAVKFTLGMAFVIAVFAACSWHGLDPVIRAAGGTGPLLLGLLVLLSAHAIAIPQVRAHRGIPTARPSAGPAVGALLFVLVAAWTREPTAHSVLLRAAACALAGTLGVGTIQRVRAAARRLEGTAYEIISGDVRASSRTGPEEAGRILGASLRLAPFLAIPPLAAGFCLWTGQLADPRLVPLAALIAALPPLLFDAKRGGPAFAGAGLIAAGILAATGAMLHAEAGARALLFQTALVVLAYPACAESFRRAEARRVAVALVLYVVLRAGLLAFAPDVRAPVAELAFLVVCASPFVFRAKPA